MGICYIADNRTRCNWGCRATSIALKQLLAQKTKISSIIGGDSTFNTAVMTDSFFKKEIPYAFDDPEKALKVFSKIYQKYPLLNDYYQKIASADAVVINGEGTFIFTTPSRPDTKVYLLLTALALYLKKKVYIVNSIFSYPPEGTPANNEVIKNTLDIFKKCELVALRDPLSYEILNKFAPDVPAKYIPDALFSWKNAVNNTPLPLNPDSIIPFPEEDRFFGKWDFSSPYICISGGSLAAAHKEKAAEQYIKLTNKMKETGLNIYLVQTCGGEDFLNYVSEKTNTPLIPVTVPIISGAAVLANAALYISGRFHPSVMASLGGTLCIFMKSNSHKTFSLQQMLNYPAPHEYEAAPTDEDIENIYKESLSLAGQKELRAQIEKAAARLAEKSLEIQTIFSRSKK